MKTTYTTHGTCAKFIDIELENNQILQVNFVGGCKGNTSGLSALVEGMSAHEVIQKLKGITCRNNTSCPDQLASALDAMIMEKAS